MLKENIFDTALANSRGIVTEGEIGTTNYYYNLDTHNAPIPFEAMKQMNMERDIDGPTAVWARIVFQDGKAMYVSPRERVYREFKGSEIGILPFAKLHPEEGLPRIGELLPCVFIEPYDLPYGLPTHPVKSVMFATRDQIFATINTGQAA